MLHDDYWNENIDSNLTASRLEIMFGFFSLVQHLSLSMSSSELMCKVFNSFFNEPIIPNTKYFFDKYFYSNEGITYHAVCSNCKDHIGTFTIKDRIIHCNVCNTDINLKSSQYRDYFATFDVSQDVKQLLQKSPQYYEKVILGLEEAHDNRMSDICDGQLYKQFKESLNEDEKKSFASFTFNSDGAPLYKSSNTSIWPIQLCINEIEYTTRSEKPIVFGIWFGKDKPNMTTFLRPFVNQMNTFSNNGIPCNFNGENKEIKLYALCCCVDSVARAPIQGLIQYNGYFGCSWCYHPGKAVRANTRKVVKYPLLEDVPELRDAEMSIEYIDLAVNLGAPVYGWKNASPLLLLHKFNIIKSIVPDAMHCILLGIVKRFFQYWFFTSGNDFFCFLYRLSQESRDGLLF